MQRKLRIQITFFVVVLLTVNCTAGCEDVKPIDEQDRFAPDVLTSATPNVTQQILQNTHSGWAQHDCGGCHDNWHDNGFSIEECSYCHGTNGAPARPVQHPDSGCTSAKCHVNVHNGLYSWDDNHCRSCHEYSRGGGDCTHREKYDVVIIGAGGGGLGAAAELASAGMNVLLLEQSFDVGGCMTTLKRGDYLIEGSLFGTDGLGFQTLMAYENLGIQKKAKATKCEPFIYRIHYPGLQFDVPADVNEYHKKLVAMFPAQESELASLFEELTDLSRALGNEEYSFSMVLQRHGITDKLLVSILTRLGSSFGTDPDNIPAASFATLWYSMHSLGHYYWRGGSQAVADAMRDTFLENGGTLKIRTKANKIAIEDGYATLVRTESGGCYEADYVISNVNEQDTFLQFVGEEYLEPDFVRKVEDSQPGLSGFHIYLGVNHDYSSEFGDTYGIMVSEDPDPWSNYDAVQNCDAARIDYVLVNYTLEDPTNAPIGKNVITINTQLNYDCFDRWGFDSSYEDYNRIKREIAFQVIERAETILPQLTEHIEVLEVGTPRTIESFTLNPRGSIFGSTMMSGQNKNPMDPNITKTPIPNLYLVGAWAIGGGQWVVVHSGVTAARLIIEDSARGEKSIGQRER